MNAKPTGQIRLEAARDPHSSIPDQVDRRHYARGSRSLAKTILLVDDGNADDEVDRAMEKVKAGGGTPDPPRRTHKTGQRVVGRPHDQPLREERGGRQIRAMRGLRWAPDGGGKRPPARGTVA